MNRIKTIDGLRGIAVLIVLMFHLLNNSYQNTNVGDLNQLELLIMRFTSFGWAGVNLFFIISGYLIGSILLKNKNSINYFVVFYTRRFLRIIPIYFLFLCIYLICRWTSFDAHLSIFEKPIPIWTYFILVQNFMMSSLGHFGPNALTVTWSLAVEEQFYLVVPFIVYYLNERQLISVTVFFIVFSSIYRLNADNWYESYTHFLSRLDSPLLGLLLAIFRSSRTNYFGYFNKWVLRSIVLLALLGVYSIDKCVNHLIISFFFFILLDVVIDLNDSSFIHKIITGKFILLIGKYSFFIYLFHQLVNGMLFAIFQGKSNPNLDFFGSYLIEIGAFLLTFLLAHFSFIFLESKFIARAHRFKY
jgi:peptidoglycan/LPS O-acetylase OafA/YrhL